MFAGVLPSAVRAWFESSFPEWSLPSRIVLKRQKEGWDEEFETEKAAYERLKPLQGVVIPKCYGELRYNGAKALLLSDIGGVCLATPEGALLEVAELRRLLHEAFTALGRFGALHDDTKLDNFHLVGDKIMVMDLESVSMDLSDEQFLASRIKSKVNYLAEFLEDNQYCFWEDGLIMIATLS